MLEEAFLENIDDVTSGQTAANRYRKALAGNLVNDRHTLQLSIILGTVKDNIVTPYRVRELCPGYPLCRGAQKLTFTTLSNHLKPPHGGESTGLVHD